MLYTQLARDDRIRIALLGQQGKRLRKLLK